MSEHRRRNGANVLGHDVRARREQGMRLGSLNETKRCTRTCSKRDLWMRSRVSGDRHGVVVEIIIDVYARTNLLERNDLLRVEQCADGRRIDAMRAKHERLFTRGGVAHRNANEEPIDL